jgi:hypothetical protein
VAIIGKYNIGWVEWNETLAGVAYDKTLRIIANANGSVDVAVSSLALQ